MMASAYARLHPLHNTIWTAGDSSSAQLSGQGPRHRQASSQQVIGRQLLSQESGYTVWSPLPATIFPQQLKCPQQCEVCQLQMRSTLVELLWWGDQQRLEHRQLAC